MRVKKKKKDKQTHTLVIEIEFYKKLSATEAIHMLGEFLATTFKNRAVDWTVTEGKRKKKR